MNHDREIGDIDIDFGDRNLALSLLEHTPASMFKNNQLERHNTGIYFHYVPLDPITNISSIDYETAEKNGWFKMDFLNVYVYEKIKDEFHLIELMNKELDWKLFESEEFVKKLIHLGNHSELVANLKPKSILDIAIILALIRPGKKELTSKCRKYGFKSIEKEIWNPNTDGSYGFRKSHSISYATLVYVHANLLIEHALSD